MKRKHLPNIALTILVIVAVFFVIDKARKIDKAITEIPEITEASTEPQTVPTVTDTPTATPTLTPVPIATPYKFIYNGNVNCRSGPGDSFSIILTVQGQVIAALAKDSVSPNWIFVQIETGQLCWLNNNVVNVPSSIVNTLPTTDFLTPRITFTPITPEASATFTPRGGKPPELPSPTPVAPTPNYTLTAQAISKALTEQARATSMHVDDISGNARLVSDPPFRWVGEATITVVNGNGQPLANITVTGKWGNGNPQSCKTDQSGKCTITSQQYKGNDSSVTFNITGLSGGYNYVSNENSDSQVTVNKPQ